MSHGQPLYYLDGAWECTKRKLG